jgi:hypothetical protein
MAKLKEEIYRYACRNLKFIEINLLLALVDVPYTRPSGLYAMTVNKLSLQQAAEAHRVVRRRGSHIF